MGSPCHLTQNHQDSKFLVVFPPHVPADDIVLQTWQSVLQEVTPNNPFGGALAVQRGSTNSGRDVKSLISSASFLPTAEHTVRVHGLT